MSMLKQLKQLSKPALVNLIDELYGIYGDIDEIIERHVSAAENSGASLNSTITRQLKQIKSEKKFIDYYSSGEFSIRLESILLDINTLLREQDLKQALQATEQLLWLSESVLERADDSNGSIGEVFSDAVDQWLDIAAELRSLEPDAENWVEKVLQIFDNNDYGVFDNIIRHSDLLLLPEELIQLAWRFEAEAKKALQTPAKKNEYNSQAAHACIALRSVAEAKGDMELFEKSYLLSSPTPNSLQIEQIVQFALAVSDFERARYWLAQPQMQTDKVRSRALRTRLLELQGDSRELKKYLAQEFAEHPSDSTLEAYWEVANATDRKALYKQVAQLATAASFPEQAVAMLLRVDNKDLAEKLLLDHWPALSNLYYSTFLYWLERFDESSHPLACVICYRYLLNDLLDRGYSKAYRYGANYFHTLLKLDKQIKDYRHLENAQAYIESLQAKHGRKRSFWDLTKFPNK